MKFTDITPEMLLEDKIRLSDVDLILDSQIGEKVGRKKSKIPPWYAFIVYYLTGSSNKASDYLLDKGIKTKRGNPFAPNAVLFSVWEWLLYNLEYARKFLQRDFVVQGKPFTDDAFWFEMIRHAVIYKVIMPDHKLITWLEENNLTDEKYLKKIKERRPQVYRHFQTRSN